MILPSFDREDLMKRFVEGVDRGPGTLFPERLDEWIGEDNAVRVIDAFVDELDLGGLDFGRVEPEAAGRPSYHPTVLLKLHVYGSLNRVQSSRRLEREAGRNVEVMWLTGRLVPDHKTITDFRKDHGLAILRVCSQFVALCRQLVIGPHRVVHPDVCNLSSRRTIMPRKRDKQSGNRSHQPVVRTSQKRHWQPGILVDSGGTPCVIFIS
jgi:transposase